MNTANELSISYSCVTSFTVAFTGNTSPGVTNLQWDFGDTASGNLNKAIGIRKIHTFFTQGTYTITLTATGQSGETLSKSLQISIINIKFKPLWNPLCYTETYPYEIDILGGASNTYDVLWEDPVDPPDMTYGKSYQDGWFSEFPDVYGLYKITLSAPYTCTAIGYYNHEPSSVVPLSHTATTKSADCSLSNGSATIVESGGTPPYKYAWRFRTDTTASVLNLPAGNYFITVKDTFGCVDNVFANVNKIEPSINHHENIKEPICTANGIIDITMSGGTMPYRYSWTPAVSNSFIARNLSGGAYNVQVKDKNGCTKQFTIKLKQQTSSIDVQTNITSPDCGLANGSILLLPSGGTLPYSYEWQSPIASSEVSINNLVVGTYSAIVTDVNGCVGSVKTTLYEKPLKASLGNDTFLCPGKAVLLSPGAFSAYLWSDGSTQPTLTTNTPGKYSVTVTNVANCVAKTSILVETGCGNVAFPSAFTPNGDLVNDQFGPVGTLSKLKKYSLQIYNRYGTLVFRSQNPYDKWKGQSSNLPANMNTYVFIAQYEMDGEKKVTKGTVILLY